VPKSDRKCDPKCDPKCKSIGVGGLVAQVGVCDETMVGRGVVSIIIIIIIIIIINMLMSAPMIVFHI
jgi:hypothetical protein